VDVKSEAEKALPPHGAPLNVQFADTQQKQKISVSPRGDDYIIGQLKK
jgi:hypothetical protein